MRSSRRRQLDISGADQARIKDAGCPRSVGRARKTRNKMTGRGKKISGCLGDFLAVVDNAVYRRFGTRFPQDSKAIFAQTAVSQQFVPPLTVFLQSRLPAFESDLFAAHVSY